jgi:transposase
MTELCARYGVSRRIGYKWLTRFNEDGKRGLVD